MTDRLLAEWSILFPHAPPDAYGSATKELLRCYGEPHRRYHTLAHIDACLYQLQHFRMADVNRDVVSVALFCHDIFYDTKAINNEKRSAVWCRNTTRLLGRPELGVPAAECIMATRHDREPTTPESKLVCDIDLSILGSEPATFDEYERQIREEYDWVPEEQFRAARTAILTRMLEGGQLFRTYIYQYRYGRQAIENLRRSIEALGGKASGGESGSR